MSSNADASTRRPPRGAYRYRRFADVALPLPLLRTFTYGVTSATGEVAAGCRVRVRFGPRVLVGCVLRVSETPPELPEGTEIQPLLGVLDEEPILDDALLALGQWMIDYYVAPPGDVLRGLLPPETPRGDTVRFERTELASRAALREGTVRRQVLDALARPMTQGALRRMVKRKGISAALRFLVDQAYVRRVERERTPGGRRIPVAAITEEGRRALASGSMRPNAARVLTLLATATDPVPLRAIRNELDLKSGPFRSLSRQGWIRLSSEVVSQTPWNRLALAEEPLPALTADQRNVLDRVERAIQTESFLPLVLHGVTGSGKTEIYLKAAERAVERGRSALLLVPEIALTPRLAGLLHGRFRDRVAILHSALGVGERRDEWWRIRRGEAKVVVGARAAVLAPLCGLGLVVVDEEHESSYKQEESPRYHARDLAIKRARDADAVVLLGSATPSLESYYHTTSGRYELASLSERIGGRPLATVGLVDMKDVVREEGPETILSRPLREAIEARLAAGEQAIILLNRRGYAGQLICRECGLVAQCSDCSVGLTLHQKGTLAICHYCGLGRPRPTRCDVCRGEYLRHRGYGTERVEELLNELFPEAHVARMDRDTMRRKGSYEAVLSRFSAGELDLLVGTQMLAKGHDFPAVTLVGVLAADSALGIPDFRAAERTFQLLTQVAGRAGRGARPGQVLIQTFTTEHYSLELACAQDYRGFYEEEIRFRRGLAYPPLVALINLIFEAEAMPEATRQARRVTQALEKAKLEDVTVLGPAFAPRSRVAKRYRCQVLIKFPRRQHRLVKSLLRALTAEAEIGRRMSIDVDPVTIS